MIEIEQIKEIAYNLVPSHHAKQIILKTLIELIAARGVVRAAKIVHTEQAPCADISHCLICQALVKYKEATKGGRDAKPI